VGVNKLSPRLSVIAEEIAKNGFQDIIYDIGTDNAYLPIFLVKNGYCGSADAADISAASLERAGRNIEKAGLSDRIALYTGDGLASVSEYLPSKIVILAGIGGNNLAEIVGAQIDKAKAASCLILQPMHNQEVLREWLWQNSFEICHERLAQEGRRVYSVFVCRRSGAPVPYTPVEAYIGKKVLYKNRDEYVHFLRFTRLKAANRYNGAPSSDIKAIIDAIDDIIHTL